MKHGMPICTAAAGIHLIRMVVEHPGQYLLIVFMLGALGTKVSWEKGTGSSKLLRAASKATAYRSHVLLRCWVRVHSGCAALNRGAPDQG